MKNTQYILMFILLSVTLFSIAYASAKFIENNDKIRHKDSLLKRAQFLSSQTIDILSDREITEKSEELNLIFQKASKNESSLAFYQLAKINRGMYQPLLIGKKENNPMIMLNINDLNHHQGQIINGLIKKGPYLIYHRDMISGQHFYGKLFIAFNQNNFTVSSHSIYVHIFAFTFGVLLIAIFVFVYFRKKMPYSPIDHLKTLVENQINSMEPKAGNDDDNDNEDMETTSDVGSVQLRS